MRSLEEAWLREAPVYVHMCCFFASVSSLFGCTGYECAVQWFQRLCIIRMRVHSMVKIRQTPWSALCTWKLDVTLHVEMRSTEYYKHGNATLNRNIVRRKRNWNFLTHTVYTKCEVHWCTCSLTLVRGF